MKLGMHQLALRIAEREGGETNLNIAEIKQVLKLVALEIYDDNEVISVLIANGKKHKEG